MRSKCEVGMKALINKETLKTICIEKGVSDKYLAERCNIVIAKMKEYLDPNDDSLPSFSKAKDIAKKLHVPFAGLYMDPSDLPIPQIKKHIFRNYRRMTTFNTDNSVVNLAICDLLEMRESYFDSIELIGETKTPYSGIYCDNESVEKNAEIIRSALEISIYEQQKQKSKRKMFLYIRKKIEEKGIFVGCFTGVPVEVLRGVSIFDSTPVIGINDEDSFAAKSFSLIHELAHIMKKESTICNEMYSSFSGEREEVFCNAVAGEVLVPKREITAWLEKNNFEIDQDIIRKMADYFSVSREVITRRLLDNKKIGKDTYSDYMSQFEKEFRERKEREKIEVKKAKQKGRPYGIPQAQHMLAINRNSSSYCQILYKGFCGDVFSKQDIARSLNIKPKHVDGFIDEVARWNN